MEMVCLTFMGHFTGFQQNRPAHNQAQVKYFRDFKKFFNNPGEFNLISLSSDYHGIKDASINWKSLSRLFDESLFKTKGAKGGFRSSLGRESISCGLLSPSQVFGRWHNLLC